MANDPTFNYLKLLADWLPSWLLLAMGLVLWIALNPALLRKIRENVSGAKFGSFEIQLRELKEQVVQAQAQVQDLTEANRQLSEIVAGIDPDAPAEQIAGHARRSRRSPAISIISTKFTPIWTRAPRPNDSMQRPRFCASAAPSRDSIA